MPAGWTEHYDTTHERHFYHCAVTGESTWIAPMLPAGWTEHYDTTHERHFCHCAVTGESTWIAPTAVAPSTVSARAASADTTQQLLLPKMRWSPPTSAFFNFLAQDASLPQSDQLTPQGLAQMRHMCTALSPCWDFDDSSGRTIDEKELIECVAYLSHPDSGFLYETLVHAPVPWSDLPEGLLPPDAHQVVNRPEWFRQAVTYRGFRATEVAFCNPDGPSTTFYHGTTAFPAHEILLGGGFLAGPNGHTKGKTHYKGCFGSTLFTVAQLRGDPTRGLAENPDHIYTFSNCPCVLELEAASATLKNFKRGCPYLIVVPGHEGRFMPGILLKAIHWNVRYVRNFRALKNPAVRQAIRSRGGVFQACCGSFRQQQDFQSCGDYDVDKFVKLGKHYVCSQCFPLWR
jgi:hypothetical protein